MPEWTRGVISCPGGVPTLRKQTKKKKNHQNFLNSITPAKNRSLLWLNDRTEGRVILSNEIQSNFYKDDVDYMSFKGSAGGVEGHSIKEGPWRTE